MKTFAAHPGEIRMVEEFDGSVKLLQADAVPDRQRFVFLNAAGIEVDSIDQASMSVPIVEVRMVSTDGNGKLVPRERAALIRINEYGPSHQLLRATTLRGQPAGAR